MDNFALEFWPKGLLILWQVMADFSFSKQSPINTFPIVKLVAAWLLMEADVGYLCWIFNMDAYVPIVCSSCQMIALLLSVKKLFGGLG